MWRDDPTNTDPTTVRGRLRRDVFGVLEELWPGAAVRAGGTADLVELAARDLRQRLEDSFGDPEVLRWSRAKLAELPRPIIAAGLRRAALNAAPEAADTLGQTHLLQAASAITDDDQRPRTFDWPYGLVLGVESRFVQLTCSRP